mgnify:FL=1
MENVYWNKSLISDVIEKGVFQTKFVKKAPSPIEVVVFVICDILTNEIITFSMFSKLKFNF